MECDDDVHYLLHFHSEAQAQSVPLNTKILLYISSQPEADGHHLVPDKTKFFAVVSDTVLAKVPNISHYGVFIFARLDASDEDMEKIYYPRAASWAQYLQDAYRFYALNPENENAYGFVIKTSCNPVPFFYCSDVINRFIREEGIEISFTNYHAVGGSHPGGAAGAATLGGKWSATYWAGNMDVMVQEITHNKGFKHQSEIPWWSGERVEYGDGSFMGHGVGFNGVEQDRLGWVSDDEKFIISETQQVLVGPLGLKGPDLRVGEHAHNIIAPPNRLPAGMELRPSIGYPYVLFKDNPEFLIINRYELDNSSLSPVPHSKPGESATFNGTRFEYLKYFEGVGRGQMALVNVYINPDDPRPTDLVIPTGFREGLSSIQMVKGMTGSWADPKWPNNGQGVDIFVLDTKFIFYYYTFEEEGGSRRWLVAYGDIDGDLEFDLLTSKDGTFEDSTTAEVYEVGRGKLVFESPTHGRFLYDTKEWGRGSIEIKMLLKHPTGIMTGAWGVPDNKDGFTFQFFKDLTIGNRHFDNFTVGKWYTHGTNGTQRWWICTGDGNHLTINEVIDGVWRGLNPVEEEDVGSLDLTIVDVNHIDVEYDIKTDVTGHDTFHLERLFEKK